MLELNGRGSPRLCTCAVGQVAGGGRGQPVDVVVAQALLHLDGGGAEGAAMLLPVAADLPGDDAVASLRMGPGQPQRRVRAALVGRDAPLGHLDAFTVVEEAVPTFGSVSSKRDERKATPAAARETAGYASAACFTFPFDVSVAHLELGGGVGCAPGLVQNRVVEAGVP